MADETSHNSCCLNVTRIVWKKPVALLTLNIGIFLHMQFIPSDVFFNICKLLTFLLMRHPHSGYIATLLSCSTSRTPLQTVTTCQYVSLHLLQSAITHPLHCTVIPTAVTVTVTINIFSHNQHALYEQFYYFATDSTLNSGQDQAVIQKYECIRRLKTSRWRFPSFTLKFI